jgi:hypothetical protein
MSHDVLDDLLADVPRHVTADPAAAWRAGTSRRRRRYAAQGLAVAAAVVVGLLALTFVDAPDSPPVGPADKVVKLSGHPAVVDRPFFEEPLPERPGPLAGVIKISFDGSWFGVDQSGRSWPLATANGTYAALSDDGTQLGQLVGEEQFHSVYETTDLTTGKRVGYPSVGDGSGYEDSARVQQEYFAAEQQPAYWSPDGARLVVPGGRMDTGDANALLLEDGEVTALDVPGFAVGWASPTTIVWLAYDGSRATITDLSGTALRVVDLQLKKPMAFVSQWIARVSPDGTRLAVIDIPSAGKNALWTFSLADGSRSDLLGRPGVVEAPTCPLMWHGDQVAVWQYIAVHDYPGNTQLISRSDNWGTVTCSSWAADGLAGSVQPGPGITEWRHWSVWWHWRRVLLLVGIAALLGGVLVFWRLTRPDPEPTPGAPSAPSSG